MNAFSGTDCSLIDNGLYDADNRPDDGRIAERRAFHLLQVRAYAGLASHSDAAHVVRQLQNPASLHTTTSLLSVLGRLGSEYEDVVAPFLDHSTANVPECAMRALFQMGLHERYVDRFVEWMQGAAPPHRLGNISYGMATHAFRQSQNPKILRALIEASNDRAERWTTREHARNCLALAIDLENAPTGRRIPADDPYFADVLERAAMLLDELTTNKGGA